MATIIEMPKLSDTMSVGTLVNWLKNEGDTVTSGDKIAEIETDKATMEMEVFDEGVVLKHFVSAGEQVAIGDPICAVGKKGEKVDAPEKKKEAAKKDAQEKPKGRKGEAEGKPAEKTEAETEEEEESEEKEKEKEQEHEKHETREKPPAKEEEATEPKPAQPAEAAGGDRIKISPLARKLADEKGIDISDIAGSGPGGRIVKADVLAAAKKPKPPAAPAASPVPAASAKGKAPGAPFVGTVEAPIQEGKSVQVSNVRAIIARRLLESKTQIPHFYLEIEIDAAPLMELRQQVNAAFGEGTKVSVNDFILKACAHALRKVPAANTSWEGNSIRQHAAANVSFAVAIDDGLITPVVFDAHKISLFQISAEARALAIKAKAKKLQPAEFTGGTFCVSNLGMFGIDRFSAIINPPNGAILAVGATVKKPVVNEKNEIVPGQRMSLTLSCDHRVVDGAVGAQFLSALRDILEKPLLILG
ncbi:MAG: pyruvate dehydrogenase complex dihydrolipoamide acetyltransferase [Opitutaceae bacterium]